jgi:hypothetical protein
VYVRVDSVRVDGEPVLMALELIEPDLGFGLWPAAASALADAVVARIQ